MKKCPTCEKTFEDSMRFCQTDGTPLVDDAPAFDPYATIVGKSIPVPPVEPEPATEAPEPVNTGDGEMHQTVGSIPISEPEDVLDLPSDDPLKTMYVSEAEMKEALSDDDEGDVMEIPAAQPEPPSFLSPEPPAAAPPPSPFAAEPEIAEPELTPAPEPEPEPESAPQPWTPAPEPQPEPEPPAPTFEESPRFDEAETVIQPSFQSPFDQPAPAPVAEWTPPPPPEQSWKDQEIGSNTPFQPPPAGTEGQNKTLAIVSLVLGILGVTICCGGLLPSIAAIVLGFMARGKISSDPAQYGGSGLAMGGIITGVLGLVLGIVLIILQLAFGVLGALQ